VAAARLPPPKSSTIASDICGYYVLATIEAAASRFRAVNVVSFELQGTPLNPAVDFVGGIERRFTIDQFEPGGTAALPRS
jgi:hypothetical protein